MFTDYRRRRFFTKNVNYDLCVSQCGILTL